MFAWLFEWMGRREYEKYRDHVNDAEWDAFIKDVVRQIEETLARVKQ